MMGTPSSLLLVWVSAIYPDTPPPPRVPQSEGVALPRERIWGVSCRQSSHAVRGTFQLGLTHVVSRREFFFGFYNILWVEFDEL